MQTFEIEFRISKKGSAVTLATTTRLTHCDLVGVLGIGEGQVDHVFLLPSLVQARFNILPPVQHVRYRLLVSNRCGHVRPLCQLPVGGGGGGEDEG